MNGRHGGTKLLLIGIAVLAILPSLLFVTGCSSGGATTTPTNSTSSSSGVSYSKDVQPIFNNYCVVCHQGAGQAGLTLEPNKSYNNLVYRPIYKLKK